MRKLIFLLSVAAIAAPQTALAYDSSEIDAVLRAVPTDTKADCEAAGGVWTVVTDEEKHVAGAYCDLASSSGVSSWAEADAGTSSQGAVARANALVRFYDGRLSTAKSAFAARRELSTGATITDAAVARLLAANVAESKTKAIDAAAQKRIAVREQVIAAWQRARAAITRVEEEWKKRAAAAKKP